MAFADLKKKSGSFANLTKEIEKMSSGGKKVDERFWKPQVDKSGNGFAVIRFLPESEGADLPWAQVWSHAFQGPGGWYIENSLTTLGQKDPVSALNSSLWNSGNESDKDIARKQKRKLSYYSNIYVVKDPLNPENEGKVFLYKYGKRIFDKIMAKMQPNENDYDPEPAFNPFDLWKGADFKLKIKQVAGYWNYDDSSFTTPNVLGSFDDAKLEEIYTSAHDLAAFTAPDQFKSYDELDARLKSVLGPKTAALQIDESLEDESEGRGSFNAADITPTAPAWTEQVTTSTSGTDEDDTLSYFAKLAEEE
jgi:hypothetical protein|tara:strand:+ start:163 stop:1083 length:921 start_codon:yes stop_codon:yes gene_type:complete